jgi:hypothetical protein
MPPRSLYPGDLLNLLWRHKHTRVQSIGIEANRWGRQQREAVGLSPHGTLWVSGCFEKEEIKSPLGRDFPDLVLMAPAREVSKEYLFPVPCNNIPYAPVKDATFNPETHRFEGNVARGWRHLLTLLVGAGILRGCAELTYMTGEDTWEMMPKPLRI